MHSQSDFLAVLNYDRATGIFTRKVKQVKHEAGSISGSVNYGGYVLISVLGRAFPAHRLAWFMTYGVWPTGEIDHIDGNPANNRLENLRDVTTAINAQNMHVKEYENGRIGVKHTSKGWEAGIFVNKKRIRLGFFKTADEAQEEYFKAKREFHPGFTGNLREGNMGAKTSRELRNAINLLRAGYSISDAARMAKVARSTIYRSSQYKALMAERAEQGKQQ